MPKYLAEEKFLEKSPGPHPISRIFLFEKSPMKLKIPDEKTKTVLTYRYLKILRLNIAPSFAWSILLLVW